MGQRGYSDNNDPRFSVAFVSTDEASDDRPAIVQGCSFHNGYASNLAIEEANGVTIDNNVFANSYENCEYNSFFK